MSRTSTRIPSLPTNLKERIAALEQKAGNGGAHSSRPISPTPTGNGAPSSIGSTNIPSAGNFRDKIAKFERKGGVPVPRGRFGLGAPPTSQGPQRQGELYGNRIPAPARTVSIGMYPSTRPTSPTGDPSSSLSSVSAAPDRRSFSLSNILSDFDDRADYTPVTSPTLTLPPDSPESMMLMDESPQTSPSLSTNPDPVNVKRSIIRGTSFQKALEIARNAEVAKLEGFDPLNSIARQPSLGGEEEDVEEPEATPIIVVSSEDVANGNVVVEESTTEQTVVPVAGHDDIDTSELVNGRSISPQPLVEQESIEVEVQSPGEQSDANIDPEEVQVEVSETPGPNVPIGDEVAEIVPIIPIPIPSVVESETTKMQTKETRPVVPVVIEITPLTVRKRRPTLPDPEPLEPSSHEPMPSFEDLPLQPVGPLAEEIHPTVVAVNVVSPPSTVDSEGSSVSVLAASTKTTIELRKDDEAVEPVSEVEVQDTPGTKVKVEDEQLPSMPTPPQIVVNNDDFNSRKAALSLNVDLLTGESVMSPPLQTGMSDFSLSDVIGNYFTGGLVTEDKFPQKSSSPAVTSPLSPPAKLAYDVQETPPPPPPARPRQKEVDLLSPPPTGILSASSSVGSSFSAISSSLGSRPMSMIETSPGHINRALRMTPATSRGVPVFLPPNSSLPRKSDFVYFPPTPDAEETEFGSVTMHHHKASHSLSLSEAGPPPASTATFTAVVHDKVKESEVPASAMLPSDRRYVFPETPRPKRSKRQTYLEPLSPGQGELTALLREAVWLEDTLNKGELPAEAEAANGREKDQRDLERARLEAIQEEASATAKEKEEERRRIAYATEQLKLKRDEPTAGKLKHTFLIPLNKARSVAAHRKEASAPAPAQGSGSGHPKSDVQQSKTAGEVVHPKSASATDKSGTRAMPKVAQMTTAGSSQVQRPVTPEKLEPSHTGESTSKSPKSSRFNGFRRLGSMSRANTVNGASVRHSNSTSSEISSEDSQAVVTPPQNNLEFGIRNVGEFGQSSNNSTASFPSLSPKKSGNNLGRAASFAEKMWSRARTKSSGSTLSVSSEMTIDEAPRLPPLGPPPPLNLSSLPSLPLVVPPSPELKPTKVIQPPQRSTSLKRTAGLPPIPTEPVPSLPKSSTPNYLSQTPIDTSDFLTDSLLPPATASFSSRPSSMTSLSSAGSLPSPLFDKELFDAFPSVPGTTPMPDLSYFVHRRDNSLSSAVNPNPSFDSALLSSAIHLASSYKSGAAAAPAAAAASTTTINNNVLPSRGGTPTPGTMLMSRRSGEAAR